MKRSARVERLLLGWMDRYSYCEHLDEEAFQCCYSQGEGEDGWGMSVCWRWEEGERGQEPKSDPMPADADQEPSYEH